MRIESSRFGAMELEDSDVIAFPDGIIGFPDERAFVLLRRADASPIGWLHSTRTPWLALPVVPTSALAADFPDEALAHEARQSGLGAEGDDIAVMAVLSAIGGASATVNLVAPIVINVETRVGAQVILEASPFSTQEPFLLRTSGPPPTLREHATYPREKRAAGAT